MRSLKRVAAVVGVGHSDWVGDWHRVRAGERPGDCYAYATSAFRNALADANMTRGQIDGLIVGPTTAYERMAEVLNMNVRWGDQADAVLSVVQACMAIESGMADVVALVYGNDQRSVGTQYGGPQAMGGDLFLSYVYHAPWGMTSQGALYALTFRRYAELYGISERDLGHVAVAQLIQQAARGLEQPSVLAIDRTRQRAPLGLASLEAREVGINPVSSDGASHIRPAHHGAPARVHSV